MIFDYLNVDDVYDWLKVVHKNGNTLLEYVCYRMINIYFERYACHQWANVKNNFFYTIKTIKYTIMPIKQELRNVFYPS